jgi:hypothetical protein
MNVERGERLHPIFLFPAHGVLRAETAGMKVSFAIWGAASATRNKPVDNTMAWGAIVKVRERARIA